MNKKIKKILNKKNKSKIICLTAYSKNVATILGVIIGSNMGNGVTRQNNGGTVRQCGTQVRYTQENKTVYSHSTITFYSNGVQRTLSFQK